MIKNILTVSVLLKFFSRRSEKINQQSTIIIRKLKLLRSSESELTSIAGFLCGNWNKVCWCVVDHAGNGPLRMRVCAVTLYPTRWGWGFVCSDPFRIRVCAVTVGHGKSSACPFKRPRFFRIRAKASRPLSTCLLLLPWYRSAGSKISLGVR